VLSQAQAMNKITLIFALFFLASAAVADPNAEVRCQEIVFSQSNVGVALAAIAPAGRSNKRRLVSEADLDARSAPARQRANADTRCVLASPGQLR
jgi:hypothetical protein